MRRLGLLVLLAFALITSGACYKYVETGYETLTPGADVRVRVSPDRASQLEEILDQADSRVFEGMVMEDSPSESIRLSVPFQGVEAGSARRGFNSVVEIPFLDFEGIELKEFDWGRTGGLVGASVLVATALLEVFFDPFDNQEGKDPGEVEASLVTLLKFRW